VTHATTHRTRVELSDPVPSDVEAGADMALRVKVSCSSGCDLHGAPVEIRSSDAVVMRGDLESYDGRTNETPDLILEAPMEIGEHTWRVVFPKHETESTVHEEDSLRLSLRTKPHPTSIAVWDIPSPVIVDRDFEVKVGVKCSAQCRLTGRAVEIRDGAGDRVARGTLGEAPWLGTDSLYWSEVALPGPVTDAVSVWSVKFVAADVHEAASATFSSQAARPPEHAATIQVTAGDTGAPVEGVELRLGAYEAFSDTRGLATVDVPTGRYELTIRKDGYAADPVSVEVSRDTTVDLTLLGAPTRAEMEERLMRFEDYRSG